MVRNPLFLFCFATFLCFEIAQVEGSLLQNGGFEEGLQGWTWKPGTQAASAQVMSQAGLDGGTVIQIVVPASTSEPAVASLTQTVSLLSKGTAYRVTAWVKGRNAGSGALEADGQKVPLPKGTFDWTQVETTFTANAQGNAEVSLRVFEKTDELWLNRVTLEAIEDRPGEIAALMDTNHAELARIEALVFDRSEYANDGEISMGLQIAQHYIDRLKTGGPGGTQGLKVEGPSASEVLLWNRLQARETAMVLESIRKRIEALRSHTVAPYRIPKLTGGRISFDGDGMFWSKPSAAEKVPVILGGYGFFNQINKDLDFLAATHTTLVQQEFGPREMSETGILSQTARSAPRLLQRLTERGMFADILLAPHYFPDWALKKYPELQVNAKGFINYNIDHPVAKTVVKDWIGAFVPLIGQAPGLNSLCLSNEPGYNQTGRDPDSLPKWAFYLQSVHGSIKTLNSRYGTHYADFAEVPVPAITFPQNSAQWPAYYDWVCFNQRNFAAWHRWMYDLVKAGSPEIPVHVKLVPDLMDTRPQAQRTHGGRLYCGVDPEQIAEFTDLAGCDSWSFVSQNGPFSHTWVRTQLWYDLLNSFHQRPVIDSELHLIVDRYPAEPIPPEHIYNVLWQGALHHRSAYAIWLWNEPSSNSAKGSIYMRPADVYAAGKAALDLNRLAPEIRTLNHLAPDVALVYSMTSLFWESRYPETVKNLYTALTISGYKVTFISDRQLATGQLPGASVLFLPALTHATDGAAEGIAKLTRQGFKVVPIGEDNLGFNEYHQPRSGLALPPSIAIKGDLKADMQTVGVTLKGATKNAPALMDVDSGDRTRGVDYRVAALSKGTLVSLVSVYAHSQQLKFEGMGSGLDLISGRKINLSNFTLKAREVLLVKTGR
ncbi:MAG: beta-galactosidase [Chthoniobacteraceae bacterium]